MSNPYDSPYGYTHTSQNSQLQSAYSSNRYSTTLSPSYAYAGSNNMTRNNSQASSGSGSSSYGQYSDSTASSPLSLQDYPRSPNPYRSIEVTYAGSAGAPKPKQSRVKQTSPSSSSGNNPPPAYHCLYRGCDHISGRSFDLERHMKKHNPIPAEQKLDCPGKGCGRTGAHGFDRKDHMTEHLRNYHTWDIPKGKTAAAGKSGSGSGKRRERRGS